MLSISHAATGAFIAAKVSNPLLYIPLTLASHYIEDYVLHWDVGTGLSSGKRKRIHAFLFELVDLGIAAAIVWWMMQTKTNSTQQIHMAIGAFMGLVPDFIEAPRNFFRYNPWFIKPLNAFHHAVHRSTPIMALGLFPQALLLGVILWLV